MSIAVCITTFNEAATIADLVRSFLRFGYRVIVVDDGSTDKTFDAAFQAGAVVIQTNGGYGIGPSLMLGWKVALDDPECEAIIQIDAGGSHFPYEHQNLLEAYRQGAKLVIGSRFVNGAQYIRPRSPVTGKRASWLRPILSRIAAEMCNFAQSGSCINDWTSGYRVFNRSAIEYLLTKKYYAKMHGWQIEVLAHAQAKGMKVVERPICYVAGRSSFNRKVAHEAFLTWLHVMNHISWVGSNLDGAE